MQPSPSRYLLGLAAALVVSFALVWVYVSLMPAAFLESGYADWVAKQAFVSNCDVGTSLISGDSRAEGAVDPRGLELATRNISFGAETPLEGYFFVRRAVQCPVPPRQVVLSFGMPDFTWVSEFLWENGARFGFISYGELNEVTATARALGDPSVDQVKSRLGIGGEARNFLYAIHFPPLYFNALVQGQVFRRYDLNKSLLSSVSQAFGHIPYSRHGAAAPPAVEPNLPGDFKDLPVQTAFFERTLALLQARHVQAVFIPMPTSQTVARQMTPASVAQFDAYLRGFTKLYPDFHVVEPLFVVWPDQAFLDGVHLEQGFVARFTALFNACQQAALAQHNAVVPCDLSWEHASTYAAATGAGATGVGATK